MERASTIHLYTSTAPLTTQPKVRTDGKG
jgi:hypothetical protein